MLKINYREEIRESPSELRSIYKSLKKARLRERCEVLIWLKSGEISTMQAAMNLKGRNKSTGNRLWKLYQSEGLAGVLGTKHKGQPSPLRDKPELLSRLKGEGFSSVKQAQAWILEVYGLSYTENGLGNYFRRNKIKLKTARPHHPKQDVAKRSAYKKI